MHHHGPSSDEGAGRPDPALPLWGRASLPVPRSRGSSHPTA
ncbi:hypothetical protein SHJG_1220 [Streptomyces hygroscopicus subsp. jinggangensis 5008]|nr:hypothetical protein SHJG_1220 [Streptomyces hygroscopicus subsp. jinggangensis 5008]AGF60721.1 hypothetical protein SHJGH_1055 [Streptomyces hygroscopicus subsp. jinggangensis TL01]